MQAVGNISQFPELRQIYQAICNRQKYWAFDGKKHQVGWFRNKNLYYVDHNGKRYVEQNPASSSVYAKRAQEGVKIVWVIRLEDNKYLGRIEKGVVYMHQ